MAEDIKLLPIKDIEPSPTNPRKNFPKKEQDDLLQSIRENGLAQPLLVRRVKGGYELVSGERRLRALVEMKAKTVPCYIRDLDDKQAMALQQIENLQRKDLDPLEEALGFDQLAKDQEMPTAEIAAKCGKTPAYVLRRMRLTTLGAYAQKMMAEGKLAVSCAEELTRVTDHKDQEVLLKDAWDPWDSDFDQDAYKNVKVMREMVEQKYLLELSKAPFKTEDAQLCPKAGACSACPKRTGNQQGLFGGVEAKDLCLDQACWTGKIQATRKAVLDRFQKEGRTILRGPAAIKAIAELPKMDDRSQHLKGQHTWRQAMAKVEGFEPVVAVDAKGKVFELVDVMKCKDKIPKEFQSRGVSMDDDDEDGGGQRRAGGMTTAQKAQRRQVIRANKAKLVMRDLVTVAITQASPKKLEGKVLQAVLDTMVRAMGYSDDRAVGSRIDPSLKSGMKAAVSKFIKENKDAQAAMVLQILCSYAVSDQSGVRFDFSHGLQTLAPVLGINLKQLQAGAFKVVDDLAAAKLKAREAKAAKKGK